MHNLRLWYLPMAMAGFNAAKFAWHLQVGEVKVSAFMFAILYISTIPAAVRGDIGPFCDIACRSTPWG